MNIESVGSDEWRLLRYRNQPTLQRIITDQQTGTRTVEEKMLSHLVTIRHDLTPDGFSRVVRTRQYQGKDIRYLSCFWKGTGESICGVGYREENQEVVLKATSQTAGWSAELLYDAFDSYKFSFNEGKITRLIWFPSSVRSRVEVIGFNLYNSGEIGHVWARYLDLNTCFFDDQFKLGLFVDIRGLKFLAQASEIDQLEVRLRDRHRRCQIIFPEQISRSALINALDSPQAGVWTRIPEIAPIHISKQRFGRR